MHARPAAHLDSSGVLAAPAVGAAIPRPRIVATFGPRTPALEGVDVARMDGAAWDLTVLARLRERREGAAWLTIPGGNTVRRGSLATRSELLVFAAAAEFDGVILEGVQSRIELERAREMLKPGLELVAGVAQAPLLRRGLEGIAEEADAVLLLRPALERQLGLPRLRDAVHCALLECARHGSPCLLAGGLLPSLRRRPVPIPAELQRLEDHIRDGVSGLVLLEETARGTRAQEAVDILRLVADTAPLAPTSRRAAASIAGPTGVVHDLPL